MIKRNVLKTQFHILYICAVLVLLASCGPGGSSFRVKGTFSDMQTGELYIYNLSDDNARLDTLTIQEGKFLYRGQAEEVTPYILVFPNGMEQVIFVGPGEDLAYKAKANDLKSYVVEGSDENEVMNKFRKETYTLNPTQTIVTARAYIKENPSSAVSLYLLDKYLVQDEEVSDKELKELLKELKAHHQHNHYLLDIENQIANAERRQVGKKLADVSLVDRNKAVKKLWSQQKEYNLVAYWALWMPGGYDFLWKMQRCCDEHRESGRLRVVTISLDQDRETWLEATRSDSTRNIEHYCDGMGFESEAVKRLGINSVPYYLLTDKEHRVLDGSDNVSKLDEMLKKYIK